MEDVYFGDLILKILEDNHDRYPKTILVETSAKFKKSEDVYILCRHGHFMNNEYRGELGNAYCNVIDINESEIAAGDEAWAVRNLRLERHSENQRVRRSLK